MIDKVIDNSFDNKILTESDLTNIYELLLEIYNLENKNISLEFTDSCKSTSIVDTKEKRIIINNQSLTTMKKDIFKKFGFSSFSFKLINIKLIKLLIEELEYLKHLLVLETKITCVEDEYIKFLYPEYSTLVDCDKNYNKRELFVLKLPRILLVKFNSFKAIDNIFGQCELFETEMEFLKNDLVDILVNSYYEIAFNYSETSPIDAFIKTVPHMHFIRNYHLLKNSYDEFDFSYKLKFGLYVSELEEPGFEEKVKTKIFKEDF